MIISGRVATHACTANGSDRPYRCSSRARNQGCRRGKGYGWQNCALAWANPCRRVFRHATIGHHAKGNGTKSQWEARRQKVYVEGQNSFRLRGQSATLAGRPDLIVVRSNDALIIDIKAGRQLPAHFVQIMIYMYALPRALQQFQHAKLAGEIVYPTRTARVPMGSLHTQFKTDLGSLIRRIAADKPAARVPSEHECRFCDITTEDCPARVNSDPSTHDGTTMEF